jgi:1,4-dihydroxy-2-naphthoate octaprenyltransferase
MAQASIREQHVPLMHPGRALLAMTRPSQLALIWAIYITGVLLGLTYQGATADPWLLAAVALLIAGAAAAAHLVNEAADAETDRLTMRTAFSGGSGALAASGLEARVPYRFGLVLAGLTAFTTILAWITLPLPGVAAALLLAGLIGALLYSLEPVAAMRHGWGEPLNAVLGGLLLPLAGVAVVAGRIDTTDVLAFLPFMLVALASVMATAWPDRVADAATGKATMQVRLRPPLLRRIHALASVGAVLAVLASAAAGASPYALAGLLVVPALVVGVRTYTRRASALPNVVAMVGLGLILLATCALGLLNGWSQ